MATYLKIENPGVCPPEGFILLGATSKRLANDQSPYTIGQFGSGGKYSVIASTMIWRIAKNRPTRTAVAEVEHDHDEVAEPTIHDPSEK
jgi:hypothetical protein